jgi:hypothetical protein
MHITELIDELKMLKHEYGDIQVVIYDNKEHAYNDLLIVELDDEARYDCYGEQLLEHVLIS